MDAAAKDCVARCRGLAQYTEEPGFTTRTFLSDPMRGVHAEVRQWMEQAGMCVSVDAVGNVRGVYASRNAGGRRLLIGSHLDTVPRAGAFDGILGVVIGIALVQLLGGRRLAYQIEVVGFSEEEGVRFGVPFIGSRALIGDAPDDVRITDAIRAFGLDPARVNEAKVGDDALGYLEFHIEQGPVLESLDLPLGIVETIAGQSRLDVVFEGHANHAGTTPMHLRHDALAAAAAWVLEVEREARAVPGLVATVGRFEVSPGAANVIPGLVRASLDVRHADDAVRHRAVERLLKTATSHETRLDQPSVPMDPALTGMLGQGCHRMISGAGHDAMIMARKMPAALLFLRSPGGISHHPDESVLTDDVAAALSTGMRFLEQLERDLG